MKRLINTATAALREADSINAAIEKMMDCDSNTIVVINRHKQISGIVTEKDILRKILSQDTPGNLQEEKIRSIMTTPVEMAFLGTLESDVLQLHEGMGYLHYPVTRKMNSLNYEDFVGIISVTEIARHLISNLTQSLQKNPPHNA